MGNPLSKFHLQLNGVKMNLKYAILTGALALLLVTAVKCWRKCEDVQFCDRLRTRTRSNFMLKVSSKLDCALIGKLLNKDTNRHFDFFLTALAGGKFSIYINDPMYPRHKVNDCLSEMPLETDMIVNVHVLDIGELVHIEFEDITVNLYTDPFHLVAHRKGKEVIRINSRQILTFHDDPGTPIALDFILPQAIRAYGLPEHAEKLTLRNTTTQSEPYRLYNIDRYGYDVNSTQALYGSVPLLFGLGVNLTAAIFWLNSAQTFVDVAIKEFGLNSYFMSETGALEAYILTGPTLKDCVQQFANLTGVAPLPQMFALGLHQSRYSYISQREVVEVCEKFDENQLPLDAIWLDIDYTNKKKYFTWDKRTFPDPNSMLSKLNEQGRKAVAIIDPHVKIDEGYFVFDECETKGYFVKDANGKSFTGSSWPGLSSWIDFLNPEALSYYSALITNFTNNSNLHIWNDMNEPSIFKAEEQTMDGDCVHYDGFEHMEIHNQYGFYQTIGTYRGLMERGDRPFVLTRSFFAGSQRYAAHWTGDNVASWEHLRISIPMILTEALCGLSLVGADVGGFTGKLNEELLIRWYQTGAWYPFYRAHSAVEADRREPYLFKEKIQTRVRNSLQQRYKHLTYWYTLFWEHYLTGEPVIRPLSYRYFTDLNTYDIDDEFLVGLDVLVHPVTEKSATNVTVYLPGGTGELWYNIDCFNGTYEGLGPVNFNVTLDSVPLFYRGGSIVPIKETIRNTSEHMKQDPLTLLVFLDGTKTAVGNFYHDDQTSFDYLSQVYCYVRFSFGNDILRNEIIHQEATYDEAIILDSVIFYGLGNATGQVFIGANTTIYSENSTAGGLYKHVYTKNVTESGNAFRISDLNLDIRNEFAIGFNESML